MASTNKRIAGIADGISLSTGPIVELPKIAAPFTTIVNRALVTDFSKDLLPRMGINRIMTQAVQEVQGEVGPNGEMVFKPINDSHDQIRLYGSIINELDNNGQRSTMLSGNSSTEITFYGTGLNLIGLSDNAARSMTVTLNGNAQASPTLGTSGVLLSRNYGSNQIIPLISNQTLGTWTVRITSSGAAAIAVYGFEVLNTSGTSPNTLQLPAGSSFSGSKRLYKQSLSTDSYNSNFESGTLGTRGGHVVVYQKDDGTVKKAVTPTNASAILFPSVPDHTNEEVIRSYNWREFGAGRTDDFSTVAGTPIARAFTIDDGTTTLAATGVTAVTGESAGDGLTNYIATDHITFTFVGTGIDLLFANPTASARTVVISLNGVSLGTLSSSVVEHSIKKIASGLPYGTHTIRFTSDGPPLRIHRFIVYGPKKPTIPTGAVELADYYVMADYVANTTAGLQTIATGVLRKSALREMVYANTWTIPGVDAVSYIGAQATTTSVSSGSITHTFTGTGFEFRGQANTSFSGSNVVSLDNGSGFQTLTTSTFPTINSSSYGGFSFNSGTGNLDTNDSNSIGSGFRVSNLPFGTYSIRITNITSNPLVAHCLDIITPIHSPKSNQPGDLQNTLTVGSNGIGDSRKFAGQQVKALSNWAQAIGIANSPSVSVNAMVPIPDMHVTIRTSGNPIEIFFRGTYQQNTANATETTFQIFIDGIGYVRSAGMNNNSSTAARQQVVDSIIVPLAAGVHTIQVFWNPNSANAVSMVGDNRILKVREI